MRIARKNLILILLAVIIAGTLLSREYHAAGMAVTMIAMIFYLAVDARRAFRYARHFRRAGRRGKMRLAMWCALLIVTLTAFFGGQVSYFMLLVLLGVDYFFSDAQAK